MSAIDAQGVIELTELSDTALDIHMVSTQRTFRNAEALPTCVTEAYQRFIDNLTNERDRRAETRRLHFRTVDDIKEAAGMVGKSLLCLDIVPMGVPEHDQPRLRQRCMGLYLWLLWTHDAPVCDFTIDDISQRQPGDGGWELKRCLQTLINDDVPLELLDTIGKFRWTSNDNTRRLKHLLQNDAVKLGDYCDGITVIIKSSTPLFENLCQIVCSYIGTHHIAFCDFYDADMTSLKPLSGLKIRANSLYRFT